MYLLQNSSIKWRLTLIIMLVSFISVMLTTLAISLIGVMNMRNSIIDELMISASIVGDRNTAALVFNDDKQAETNMNVFSVNPVIVQGCLYDQSGAVFARYVNQKFRYDTNCPQNVQPRQGIVNERIQVMRPIEKMGDIIGSIYLESTMDEIETYIERQVTIAFMVAGAALLVSYLLAISFQRNISHPILNLAEVAKAVSKDKDYTIRAEPIGDAKNQENNELVILTESFNEMLSEIDAREKQLKQSNIELQYARDVAESANRSKSQFLANISHELRTPLNAIIGFSSILMNQLFGALGDQKYLEYAKDINESGVHLLDIINDILDLSKAEAGKLTLSLEEVNVSKCVTKCLTILAERAVKGGVKIDKDVPKMLPPMVADRLRFIQILLNILSNAVKFTEEGGKVEIKVSTIEEGGDVAYFVFDVIDTGIGMSMEDVDKAFQSFGQVDSGLNRKYEGTGLGLPLTKKLLELHDGTIEIRSELNKGTHVHIVMPAMPSKAMEEVEAS